MNIAYRFIEPLDVLFLRGNKLFGDPGSHGESLVPPWPSVVAGALRSRILVDDGTDIAAFARGVIDHPSLGTPATPGSFMVTDFHLARRHHGSRIEVLISPPADLVLHEGNNHQPVASRLHPGVLAPGLTASGVLPQVPILAERERGKPIGGYWLDEAGWTKYLNGQTPDVADLVPTHELWAIEHRVGVGLDAARGRAADGRLFSVQAVVMKKREHDGIDVGFLAGMAGANVPRDGLIRLGGDGRAAALHVADLRIPQVDRPQLAQAGRCRIVLTSPGLFSNGWRLPGIDDDGRMDLHGVRGRLVCASVPRHETVSGWDLAHHRPKTAQRVAPTGSVYWLDELDASPETLDKLAAHGLWDDSCKDDARRAEGFNRFVFAAY